MTTRIGDRLYAGGYVDERQGAVILLGDQIVHLSVEQCRQLAELLSDCAARVDPHPRKVP